MSIEHKKTTFELPHFRLMLSMLLLTILASSCVEDVAESRPTHTRIPGTPGFATFEFNHTNQELATLGLPTLTPGPGLETQVAIRSGLTLTKILETPSATPTASETSTATATRTPLPTHTLRPSGTPVQGVATQVFRAINQTVEARGGATFTPGPEIDDLVATLVEGTMRWEWIPTLTPSSSPTVSDNG